MTVDLRHGDCLEVLPTIPDGSVDMILTDLPYGMTQNDWDVRLPFDVMWHEFDRITKPNGIIALTASNPFSAQLLMSNPHEFRHEWIWVKNRGSNFANTVREPMKEHEHVLVFSKVRSGWTYNPQPQQRAEGGRSRVKYDFNTVTKTSNYGRMDKPPENLGEMRGPSSVQHWNIETGLHPTQKPVAMCEYLIRTYTDEGDTVLDCCMGSGTTGVAAANLKRSFIGIELNPEYFEKAKTRIEPVYRRVMETRTLADFAEVGQ